MVLGDAILCRERVPIDLGGKAVRGAQAYI